VFIRSVRQRNETLVKTCKGHRDFQREFFRKGPKYLIPWPQGHRQGDRGARGHGFPRDRREVYSDRVGDIRAEALLLQLCGGSAPGGGRFSKEGVKEMIKEIVRGEAGKLTDERSSQLWRKRG